MAVTGASKEVKLFSSTQIDNLFYLAAEVSLVESFLLQIRMF